MAEEERERKPLSLNQRNERLLQSISRDRLSKPSPSESLPSVDPRPSKVKVEGRRRLRKLSSAKETPIRYDEPPDSPEEVEGRQGGESIRDILDDLSSRLESLSVERPKGHIKAVPLEEVISDDRESEKVVVGKEKVEEALLFEAEGDENDDCLLLDDEGKRAPRNEEDDDPGNLLDGHGSDGDSIKLVGIGSCASRTYELSGKISRMLYSHQREGLKWLWGLHCSGTGGILGDDMGLGKTMQVKLSGIP